MLVDTTKALVGPDDRIQLMYDPQFPNQLTVNVFKVENGMRRTPGWNLSVGFFRKLHDWSQRGDYWMVGLTDHFVRTLKEHFQPNQIIIPEGVTGQVVREKLEEVESLGNAKVDLDDLKEAYTSLLESGEYTEEAGNALLPEEAFWIWSNPDPQKYLKSYQRFAAYCHLRTMCGQGFFMEQGTGKTYTIISIMETLADARRNPDKHDWSRLIKNEKLLSRPNPVTGLIVAPATLKSNWAKEIRRMAETPNISIELSGSPIERLFALKMAMAMAAKNTNRPWATLVTTYDNFQSDYANLQEFVWDLVAVDESQNIKDPSAKRSKAIRERTWPISVGRIPMTGTPIGNTPLDVWNQIEFIHPGASGTANWQAFKQMHGRFDRVGPGVEVFRALENKPVLKETIARNAIVVRKKDVLRSLPPLIWEVRDAVMSPDQAKAYKQMAMMMAVQIEQGLARGTMTVDHILTQLLRLAQITAGFATTAASVDPHTLEATESEIVWFSDNPQSKLNVLRELLGELPDNEKAIVWAPSVPVIKRLSQLIPQSIELHGEISVADRNAVEEKFNRDPNCRFLIGNPAVGGAGLNLLGYPPGEGDKYDTNCTLQVFYTHNWSLLQREQAAARAHRTGTRVQVRAVDILTPNSIDVDIYERLEAKKASLEDMMDVQSVLKGLLQWKS